MNQDIHTINGKGGIPRRAYGKEGDMLSVLGFGSIILVLEEQARANSIVAEAFEAGINYYDTAPSYGDVFGVRGDAEIKLGPALKPYRKECFLACKTGCRTRREAEQEFTTSLERLETDYFDLYQLHGITDVKEDVEKAFLKDGVMPFLLEKKREGRIRHIGFSAHSTEAALSAMECYDFDSALFAVNYSSWFKGGYGKAIMDKAAEKGVTRLALKSMAKQARHDSYPKESYRKCWYEPIDERDLASKAVRWTLSQPVTAAVSPGEETLYRMMLDIIREGLAFGTADQEELIAAAMESDPIFSL